MNRNQSQRHRDTEMKSKTNETAEFEFSVLLFSESPCLCG